MGFNSRVSVTIGCNPQVIVRNYEAPDRGSDEPEPKREKDVLVFYDQELQSNQMID